MAPKMPKFTVFSKSWPEMPIPELAKFVKELGFDGVELPVRGGYPVSPDNIGTELKKAVKVFEDHGLIIGSVAGSTDEKTIDAMGEAGIAILRICVGIDLGIGYMASEKKVREGFDKLIPCLDRNGVNIGVQNHCDNCVGSAIGIMHLIEDYDPKHVSAVLDPGHCAVDGEPPVMALDIVWSHLSLINFKSAFHRRTNGPEAPEAHYDIHWTTAQHSGYSWRIMVNALKERGYKGDVCLPVEYTNLENGGQMMGDDVLPFARNDLNYIKFLFSQEGEVVEKKMIDWESAGRK